MNLLPCPFCGSTDVEVVPFTPLGYLPPWADVIRNYYVHCSTCTCEGPHDLGESGAVEQWNTRPGECAEPTPPAEEAHTPTAAVWVGKDNPDVVIRAVGDGITDDTAALQAMADRQGKRS